MIIGYLIRCSLLKTFVVYRKTIHAEKALKEGHEGLILLQMKRDIDFFIDISINCHEATRKEPYLEKTGKEKR